MRTRQLLRSESPQRVWWILKSLKVDNPARVSESVKSHRSPQNHETDARKARFFVVCRRGIGTSVCRFENRPMVFGQASDFEEIILGATAQRRPIGPFHFANPKRNVPNSRRWCEIVFKF